MRKSYSFLFNADELSPAEQAAAMAYGEQVGGSVNLNDWKKAAPVATVAPPAPVAPAPAPVAPVAPAQDLKVTQAAMSAIQTPAPQPVKPSVSTPAVAAAPSVPPPPPPPPAPVAATVVQAAPPAPVAPAPSYSGDQRASITAAMEAARKQYGGDDSKIPESTKAPYYALHAANQSNPAAYGNGPANMSGGATPGMQKVTPDIEVRPNGMDPKWVDWGTPEKQKEILSWGLGGADKTPAQLEAEKQQSGPANPGGGFTTPGGAPIVGPIANAGLPNVPPGTGPQLPAVTAPPVQSGAAANTQAGLDKPVTLPATGGSATPSTFEADPRITAAIMDSLGRQAQTGPDDDYLKRGREVIDTRFDRQLEDQFRRNDEFMSQRGILGSSIEGDSRRNIERDISEARAAAEFDLLNNDRQYGLSRDSLNLNAAGQRGNLALGAGSMSLQANAQRLDDIYRNKALGQQGQIAQAQMELQRMGMSADNAYRYASLAQDSNFRAEALKLQQQGMSLDEAYRTAELKFRKDASAQEFGQRDRALGQDDTRITMAILDSIQNSGVELDPATVAALKDRIRQQLAQAA